MGQRKQPNFRARQLGRTLHRLRKQAGRTQQEVADRLYVAPAKISRIESGQVPIYAEFELMLDIYGIPVPDWDEYIRMYERAREKGWWHAYGLDDRGFVSLEAEASELREYQIGYIPGLLQTESYMRAGFAHGYKPMKGEELETAVAVRLRRQRRLIEEPVLRLHAILDESVLRRAVLNAEDWSAQLHHVVECGKLPKVCVRVIPTSAGPYSGRAGSFYILRYPDSDEPDIAYLEYGFGSFEIEEAEKVAAAKLLFNHLSEIALDEQDSAALIEKVIAEH